MPQQKPRPGATGDSPVASPSPFTRLPVLIGQTRFIVLLAVAAVLLIATALFILATGLAVVSVWNAGYGLIDGELKSTDLKVLFLGVVTLLLKAVAFYLIGTGLYTLFVGPLPLSSALTTDSLHDLELKVVSVIILILAATFLESFAEGANPDGLLRLGGALAAVVIALVAFQFFVSMDEANHHPVEPPRSSPPDHVPPR